MRYIFGIVLLAVVPASAADPIDEATKKDLDALQGNWKLTSRHRDGKADKEADIKDIVMVNSGEKFVLKGGPSGAGASKGSFKIDATKKPKHMDRTPADGPQKGKTLKGIYELDGDTLRLCVAPPGKDRPLEFSSKEGSGNILAVFNREKK